MHQYIEFSYINPLLGEMKSSVNEHSTTTDEQVLDMLRRAGYLDSFILKRVWPKWAWPGGYPIYYITKDCGVLSADAANAHLDRTMDPEDSQFFIIGQEINWEDRELFCDHTGDRIESAYAEEEDA